MGGHGELRNLDDFAAVSRGISRVFAEFVEFRSAEFAEFGKIFRGKLWALQIGVVIIQTLGS